MNNSQLNDLFNQACSISNSFDRFLFLKSHTKEYKKSNFYKQTHMSIMKSYKLFINDYMINKIYTIKQFIAPETLGDYITNVLDNIQPDAVEELVNRIIDSLDLSQLTLASTELGEQLKNFKQQ